MVAGRLLPGVYCEVVACRLVELGFSDQRICIMMAAGVVVVRSAPDLPCLADLRGREGVTSAEDSPNWGGPRTQQSMDTIETLLVLG